MEKVLNFELITELYNTILIKKLYIKKYILYIIDIFFI